MIDQASLRAKSSRGAAMGSIALLAFVLVCLSFALQGHLFLNFADEGFLWYGTWRTSLGEVPIRDFQSYYPGRYYWGALWSQLFGEGIIALRMSNSIFQWIGLTSGLLVLRQLNRRLDFLVVSGVILLVWMYPRHKLFDVSLALAAVYVVTALFEDPKLTRHFFAGLFVGMAGFFGLNHGLYASVAVGLAIIYSWLRQGGPSLVDRALSGGAGFVLGCSPMLLMLLFVPGFSESAVEDIARLLASGTTNVSLPIPWPWTIWTSPPTYLSALGLGNSAGFIVGLFYLAWVGFLGAMALYVVRDRKPLTQERAVLIAAALVSLPYLHHASVRAGISHLSQAIHPLLIGLIAAAVVGSKSRRHSLVPATLLILALLSIGSIAMLNPFYLKMAAHEKALDWAPVGGDRILLRKDIAAAIAATDEMVESHMAPEDGVFIAPRLAAYYAIMQRRAPVKELYFSLEKSDPRQLELVEKLEAERVPWAIIGDGTLDESEDFRFRSTHPLLWNYLRLNFEPVKLEGMLENYVFLKRLSQKLDSPGAPWSFTRPQKGKLQLLKQMEAAREKR